MNSIRRAIFVSAALMAAAAVHGQAVWPSKSIRLIVPFAPGGGADTVARAVAEKLGTVLGQSVVVDNKPGAVATVAAAITAKADPDGYTLLLMPGTHVLTAKLGMRTQYHPSNDFTPIGNLVFAPYAIVARRQDGRTTLKEVIRLAKELPGRISIGNSEVTTRLAAEQLSRVADIKLIHAPYKGGAPIMADVVGGHLDLGVVVVQSAVPFHREKLATALAVTSQLRNPALPDVPTMSEVLGIPEFDVQSWFALAGPAHLPRSVVERLSKAVTQVMGEKDLRTRIINLGLIPAEDTTPEGLQSLMRDFERKNSPLIEAANIKAE